MCLLGHSSLVFSYICISYLNNTQYRIFYILLYIHYNLIMKSYHFYQRIHTHHNDHSFIFRIVLYCSNHNHLRIINIHHFHPHLHSYLEVIYIKILRLSSTLHCSLYIFHLHLQIGSFKGVINIFYLCSNNTQFHMPCNCLSCPNLYNEQANNCFYYLSSNLIGIMCKLQPDLHLYNMVEVFCICLYCPNNIQYHILYTCLILLPRHNMEVIAHSYPCCLNNIHLSN